MANEIERDDETAQSLPKVLADFGGRRKIFERRLKQRFIAHKERRAKRNRRSGFDRRGALTQNDNNIILDKRSTP